MGPSLLPAPIAAGSLLALSHPSAQTHKAEEKRQIRLLQTNCPLESLDGLALGSERGRRLKRKQCEQVVLARSLPVSWLSSKLLCLRSHIQTDILSSTRTTALTAL